MWPKKQTAKFAERDLTRLIQLPDCSGPISFCFTFSLFGCLVRLALDRAWLCCQRGHTMQKEWRRRKKLLLAFQGSLLEEFSRLCNSTRFCQQYSQLFALTFHCLLKSFQCAFELVSRRLRIGSKQGGAGERSARVQRRKALFI